MTSRAVTSKQLTNEQKVRALELTILELEQALNKYLATLVKKGDP